MTETLRQKRCRFTRGLALLILYANERGYEVSVGEAWRHPKTVEAFAAEGIGSARSLHPDGLAADLNLYKDGHWLSATEAHRFLGDFWKSLGPDYCWGGDFSKPDGNHYSIAHGGRK